MFGLTDRGVVGIGKKADPNVIGMTVLTLHAPGWPTTCPPAVQGASGYGATIVSGVVTRRAGVDTAARPGRLVRGAR